MSSAPFQSLDAVSREDAGATNRLGRYRILEERGRGGMGIVYLAYDTQLERRVALKVVRPDAVQPKPSGKSDGPSPWSLMLVQEAKSMAKIVHPNVVSIFDAGTIGDDAFVAMEWIDGETLDLWSVTHSLSFRQKLSLLLALADGLTAVHRAGLLHLDVKPQNIMVDAKGSPRLTDFGLAIGRDSFSSRTSSMKSRASFSTSGIPNIISSRRSSMASRSLSRGSTTIPIGAIGGTPAYMPPEQHLALALDSRSDQYAFCATAFRFLFGKLPYDSDDPNQLVAEKLDELSRTG